MSAPLAAIVVFARAPRLGTVKTRLAAAIGNDRALAIYRDLCERTTATARETCVPVTVSFTPCDALAEMREWLGNDLAYDAQCDGDLGARMSEAIERQVRAGTERVVVIGTDCPGITVDLVRAAIASLDAADVCIGPASDGGYYLVATRGGRPEIFRDVPWSSLATLAVTLERAADAGLRVALLEALTDIDTVDDWNSYQRSAR